MPYRISLKAEDDILELYVSGFEQFGAAQAERYHDGLEAVFELLADYPQAARERPEIDPPVRIHPYRSHVVVYVIDSDGVLILRVRHGREDWSAHPLGPEPRAG